MFITSINHLWFILHACQRATWKLTFISYLSFSLYCFRWRFASHLLSYAMYVTNVGRNGIAFCRTSFLLISILLETTSSLMCQFPYFTLALESLDKLKSIKFINSLLLGTIIRRSCHRCVYSFYNFMTTQRWIHWRIIKFVIWMPAKYWLWATLSRATGRVEKFYHPHWFLWFFGKFL